ncbi:MAG: DUF4268 domain-containing protein [Kiritimatiellae bacterium]|nr:DUF4268 domain-containing protein [Kiritimatiellia bacterium]
MGDTALGTLKRHSLKKQWRQERDFSDWLAKDGIDQLANLLQMELCDIEREVAVGNYKADIVAHEDGGDGLVVIENQYDTVNHDHIGKLITYAAGLGAKTAVLIVEEARQEAITAIKWLNDISRDDFAFYLVKAELLQVDESAMAIELSVIESPDKLIRETRASAAELSQVRLAQLEFWKAYNNYVSSIADYRKVFPTVRKPSPRSWMTLPCKLSECELLLTVNSKEGQIAAALYISDNKDLFKRLEEDKSEIERECGFALEWKELPEKKASRVLVSAHKNWDSESKRIECFDWLRTHAVALRKAIGKRL